MRIHIVQKGDTLFEIAKQYGVDFEELVRLNSQLSSPDMIMPGMKIKVPGESKQVRSADKATRVESREADRTVDKQKRVAPVEKKAVSPTRDKRMQKPVSPTTEKRPLKTEARPVERPIGKEVEDDRVKPKKIEPKAPVEAHPIRPIVQPPKMPKKMTVEPREDIREVQSEHDVQYVMPERTDDYSRPMREPLPVHQAMDQAMHHYYPMHQQAMNVCHCCCHCCSCRREAYQQRCGCRGRGNPRGTYGNYQPTPYQQNMPYQQQPPGYRMY